MSLVFSTPSVTGGSDLLPNLTLLNFGFDGGQRYVPDFQTTNALSSGLYFLEFQVLTPGGPLFGLFWGLGFLAFNGLTNDPSFAGFGFDANGNPNGVQFSSTPNPSLNILVAEIACADPAAQLSSTGLACANRIDVNSQSNLFSHGTTAQTPANGPFVFTGHSNAYVVIGLTVQNTLPVGTSFEPILVAPEPTTAGMCILTGLAAFAGRRALKKRTV